MVKKRYIREEEYKRFMEIHNSNLTDIEKAEKFHAILSYNDFWETIYHENISDSRFKIIKNDYRCYKKHGLFDKYKDIYKCNDAELKTRLDNLNIIYKTLQSELSKDEKLSIIFGIYKDLEKLKTRYTLLLKFGKNDARLDSAREALDNFDFILESLQSISDKEIKNAKYRNEIERTLNDNLYLENYLYAEYVIKTYISDESSYLKSRFLQNIGIDNQTFTYCEELVKFLNPVLYKEYQEAIRENNKRRVFMITTTIRNLATGIQTGYLPDEKEFDLLEFYKRVPFKEYGTKFSSTLKDFMGRTIGYEDGVYTTINQYLYQNRIKMVQADEELLATTSISFKGIDLTPEIIHNVFRYMEINHLPKVMAVYRIVLENYIQNKIDFSLLEEEKKISEKETESIYNNPYTLILTKKEKF